MSEARTLRDRQGSAQFWLDSARSDAGADCAAAVVCQTVSGGNYPTLASAYYDAVPVEVSGAEVEGGAATYTQQTGAALVVANLGSAVIPLGTTLVATLTGGRWVTRYD